jgi:hypothetical protein
MIVMIGSIALRRTCLVSTARGETPFAMPFARSPRLDVEGGRARDPGDDREWNRAEGDRGQDEVLDHVPERLGVSGEDRVQDVEVGRVVDVDQHAHPADGW